MNKDYKVVIYTSSLCVYCFKAKTLLKEKNISFDEKNIDLYDEMRLEMIKRSNGKTSVPQIFFGNDHIGGYDDLYKLEKEIGLENK